MEHVIVLGQTPPPVNGQTVMIQAFLEGEYGELRLHYVRWNFSRTIDEMGAFQIRKLLILFETWADVAAARWKTGATTLYFPVTGPRMIAVIRDMLLLIATRWMFRKTVFHFHAAGLTEILPRFPIILKPLFNLAFRNADVAIFTAKSRCVMGQELRAKRVVAVPYGIPDNAAGQVLDRPTTKGYIPSILFMGTLSEGKGLFTLIEACALLHKAGVSLRVVCGGGWDAGTSPDEVGALIASHGMESIFEFPGVLQGEAKINAFADADIFCFPSHYAQESSPVVLTEAMSYQLPIVTTNWRGIPEVVGGSGGAFIVEPKRPDQVAECLEHLLLDGQLRTTMGRMNREWFLDHGTVDVYRRNMEYAVSGSESAGVRDVLQESAMRINPGD
jgi:glycosyltransferase involved in cell wall biosynthesis